MGALGSAASVVAMHPPQQPVLSLVERCDIGALDHIIDHYRSFTFRPETDASETLEMIKRYRASCAPDGTLRVDYVKPASSGAGRLFARGGLSLQGMAREIRNAVGYPFYHDLDMVNAHPSLLVQHCRRLGVPCPRLEEYCADRGAVLQMLGAPDAKRIVLAVINGGRVDGGGRWEAVHDGRGKAWLAEFAEEMTAVRASVVPAKYLVLARASAAKKGKAHNIMGSAVNLLLCDLENAALLAMREYLESVGRRRVGVLVFDGCMVERQSASDEEVPEAVLQATSDFVFQRTGFRLRIVAKDMRADRFDVPLDAYTGGGEWFPLGSAPPWDDSPFRQRVGEVFGAPVVSASLDAGAIRTDVKVQPEGSMTTTFMMPLKGDGAPLRFTKADGEHRDDDKFLHGVPPGIPIKGSLLINGTDAPTNGWHVYQSTPETMVLSTGSTPRTEAVCTLDHNAIGRIVVRYPDRNQKDTIIKGSKKTDLALFSKIMDAVTKSAQDFMTSSMQVPVTVYQNIVINNGAGTVYNGTSGGASKKECDADVAETAFTKMRDKVFEFCERARIQKCDGTFYKPVRGCPLAYAPYLTFQKFLNKHLRDETMYNLRPAVQDDLIRYFEAYNPSQCHDIIWDMEVFSFADGVFLRSEERFVPYDDERGIQDLVAARATAARHERRSEFGEEEEEGGSDGGADEEDARVARVHIRHPFAASGDGMPLLDEVLGDQFSPAVTETLLALIGRLFYRVGERDRWQVMPWIIGFSSTGKSLLLDVIGSLFFGDNVGVLSGNNERTFGLEDKVDKLLVVGRDLPQHMSKVLDQTLLQAMITGEDVSVPRKQRRAEKVRWGIPMVFCSNHFPDYADNAGQVMRRLVIFETRKVVEKKDPTLLDRILSTERSALLQRALRAYHVAVEDHGDEEFWDWCPAELRTSKDRLGAETSLLRRFMTMGPDDPEAEQEGGGVVYVRKSDIGRGTAVKFLARAYNAFVNKHFSKASNVEAMTEDSLQAAGFRTRAQVNTCNACGLSAVRGHAACCKEYNQHGRTKVVVVLDVELVRV